MAQQETFQYPCIVSSSPAISPNYLVLSKNSGVITVGREATNHICINAAHISRLHAEIKFNERGNLEVKDMSRNGIYCGGERLPQDKAVELTADNNARLDFKGGMVLEILFHSQDKQYSVTATDNDERESNQRRKNVTEIFFLNEAEDIDNIDDFFDSYDRLNFLPKDDEYTSGQYNLTGNKSACYRNQGQSSLSVFSDVGKKVSTTRHGANAKNEHKISPQVLVFTAVLSLLAIITAVLIF